MIDSKLHFICSFLWCHLSSLLFNVWKVFFFFRLFIQILNCLRRGCESGSCSYILATVKIPSVQFGSVRLLSPVQLCDPMYCSMPGLPITNSPSLLKLMSIESVMPSNHLIFCHLLLLLPSIFPSIRVFSKESALRIVVKVLEFQLQHQSFQRKPRTDLLWDGLVGSPCSSRNSQEASPAP